MSVAEDDRPRPFVGAVAVRDGSMLAIAHRGETGPGEHAEFCLLARKLEFEDVTGATLYTTLEPCLEDCVERIVQRGIRRVVTGLPDPHALRALRAMRRLRAAGVEVDLFLMKYMAILEELNCRYIGDRGKDPFAGRMSSG